MKKKVFLTLILTVVLAFLTLSITSCGDDEGNTPEPTMYSITLPTDVMGGKVEADKTSVEEGGTVVLTITPQADFELISIKVSGVDMTSSVTPNGLLTLTNITSDKIIIVVFNTMKATVTGHVAVSEDLQYLLTESGADISKTSLIFVDSKNNEILKQNAVNEEGVFLVALLENTYTIRAENPAFEPIVSATTIAAVKGSTVEYEAELTFNKLSLFSGVAMPDGKLVPSMFYNSPNATGITLTKNDDGTASHVSSASFGAFAVDNEFIKTASGTVTVPTEYASKLDKDNLVIKVNKGEVETTLIPTASSYSNGEFGFTVDFILKSGSYSIIAGVNNDMLLDTESESKSDSYTEFNLALTPKFTMTGTNWSDKDISDGTVSTNKASEGEWTYTTTYANAVTTGNSWMGSVTLSGYSQYNAVWIGYAGFTFKDNDGKEEFILLGADFRADKGTGADREYYVFYKDAGEHSGGSVIKDNAVYGDYFTSAGTKTGHDVIGGDSVTYRVARTYQDSAVKYFVWADDVLIVNGFSPAGHSADVSFGLGSVRLGSSTFTIGSDFFTTDPTTIDSYLNNNIPQT